MSKKKAKRKSAAISKEAAKAARLARLAPHNFKPGVSGNPSGRPKKRLLDELIEEALLANDSAMGVRIVQKLLTKALKGDVKSIQLSAERTQGKPKQAHEITGKDGGPIQIVSFIQRPPQNAGT